MKHIVRNILFLLLGLTIGIAGTVKQYEKPAEQVLSDTLPRISAEQLFSRYHQDELKANRKYWNEPIQVEGIIKEVYQASDGNLKVLLQGGNRFYGVICKIQASEEQIEKPLKIGGQVIVQGRCFGMDNNVRLTDCLVSY